MRHILRGGAALFFLITVAGIGAAQAKAGTLTCVGLYSETAAGSVSYRVGTGAWVVINVADKIPANAEMRVNVDRDWIELTPSDKPNSVYEVAGSESGEVIKKVADILKGKPKVVSFPKPSGATPPSTWGDRST
jgi:hypothetical protein